MNYQTALVAMGTAMGMRDDLPDGMLEELEEVRDTYRSMRMCDEARQEYADDVQDIFDDYGFSF